MASQDKPIWPLVIYGMLVVYILFNSYRPIPDSKPSIDLVTVFQDSPNSREARQDAARFADLCEALSEQLAYDGTLTPPRILTGVQVDDLRRWSREYVLRGESLSRKYPKMGGVMEEYMIKMVGEKDLPMDTLIDGVPLRQKWVDSFKEIAKSARYASYRVNWLL